MKKNETSVKASTVKTSKKNMYKVGTALLKGCTKILDKVAELTGVDFEKEGLSKMLNK